MTTGTVNRRVGWISMALGAGTGLVMGLWSFNGPVPTPEWLGEYHEVSRRLARLGHIAFFGLGILNILLSRELRDGFSGPRAASWASVTMNFGNIFLPLTLFGAAAFHPIKYFMAFPAFAVFIALSITAYSVCMKGHCCDGEHR
jgi:hypothetical protein